MSGEVGKSKDVNVPHVKDVCCGSEDRDGFDLTRQSCRTAVDTWLVDIATERDGGSNYVRTIDEVFDRFTRWAGPQSSDSNYGSCREVATKLMKKLRNE